MSHSLGKDDTVRAGWRVRGETGLQPPHGSPRPHSWVCSPGPPRRGRLAPGLTGPEHEALQIPLRFKLLCDMDGLPALQEATKPWRCPAGLLSITKGVAKPLLPGPSPRGCKPCAPLCPDASDPWGQALVQGCPPPSQAPGPECEDTSRQGCLPGPS